MADVTDAFFKGSQVAQAEAEHEQALQDSKLRQQVLKHQLSELKLTDQLRAGEVAKQRADLGLGQDENNPTGLAPSQRADAAPVAKSLADALMTRSLSGFGTGAPGGSTPAQPLVDTPQLGATGAAPTAAKPLARVVAPVDLTGTTAPLVLHQDETLPNTHAEMAPGATAPHYGNDQQAAMTKAGHVWVPPLKVPELGIDVPGMWYSAKAAAAEQSARAIALKRAEMPNQIVGPEDTVVAGGTGAPVYTNPQKKSKPLPQQYEDALQAGDTEGAKRILAAHLALNPGSLEEQLVRAKQGGDAKTEKLLTDAIAERARANRDPSVGADRADAKKFSEDMQLYTQDVSNGWKKHAEALKEYNDPLKHPENLDPATAKEAPTYEPPSFADWRAAHPGGAAGTGKAATAKPAAGGKKAATLEQVTPLLKGKPAGKYTLTDGSVWRVKADGTIGTEAAQ